MKIFSSLLALSAAALNAATSVMLLPNPPATFAERFTFSTAVAPYTRIELPGGQFDEPYAPGMFITTRREGQNV